MLGGEGLAYDLSLCDGEVGGLWIDGPVVGVGIVEILECDVQLLVVLQPNDVGSSGHVTKPLSFVVEYDEDEANEEEALVYHEQKPSEEELADAWLRTVGVYHPYLLAVLTDGLSVEKCFADEGIENRGQVDKPYKKDKQTVADVDIAEDVLSLDEACGDSAEIQEHNNIVYDACNHTLCYGGWGLRDADKLPGDDVGLHKDIKCYIFCKCKVFSLLLQVKMKEIVFLRNNLPKWRRAEQVIGDTYWHTPDELADLYGDITSDLSFAQTHYPDSRITLYLNNLASAIHNEIYKNKREKWSRLLTFWTREVPFTMWEARRLLLISLLISVVSAVIGMVSQLADPEYCRIILGDYYVDMTLDNISHGTPMAVYDGGGEMGMFLGITINNVFVSFRMFVLGILTSIGTAWSLFQNLDMLGCFMTFFYQHDLLWEAFLAVFLHGTLEISAIIIAGAAGLALGNGLLFPGTYSRMTSFRRGARQGLKIIVGTVPVFVVAGFIEGFVTRHTEIYDGVRLAIILLSLAFVLWYFVWLPRRIGQSTLSHKSSD